MKTSEQMVCGVWLLLVGCELKPDPRVHQAWADYFVKFADAYKAAGFPLWGFTMQNEPGTNWLTYESMNMTPETQRDFLKTFLGPTLHKAHPELNILIYDHNKDKIVEWANTIFSDPDASQYAWGTAFHWYSGDQFENVQTTHDLFPSKGLLATEATEPLDDANSLHGGLWKYGEHYAHDMMGDFNAWTQGFIDWNLMLDKSGGPLHIGPTVGDLFGSDSMLIVDEEAGVLHPQVFYYYMGHFSKFVPEGSYRISANISFPTTSLPFAFVFCGASPAQGEELVRVGLGKTMVPPFSQGAANATTFESVSFVDPNNTVVMVVMNRGDDAMNYTITDHTGGVQAQALVTIPAHAIQTLRFPSA
jgi:O-glycosyl hydrolase